MPYILNKTNGTILAVLEDASLDLTTNLSFVGRNYSGYGEIVNENLLKLLENFSNTTPPNRPLMGQLWFNSTGDQRRLNVCYDGKRFKGLATLQVQPNPPSAAIQGELWWDTTNNQLKAFNGSNYLTIGPTTVSSAKASWTFTEETYVGDNNTPYSVPFIKGNLNSRPVVAITAFSDLITTSTVRVINSNLNSSTGKPDFSNGIKKGITLAGCDAKGSSRASDYYFWGTAAESLTSLTTGGITVSPTVSGTFFVPFVNTYSGGATVIGSTSSFSYNATTNVLNATATSAFYADLAERYESDKPYEVGTVLVIGGEKEVTTTNVKANTAVIGIVSKNPAYMMNSSAGNDETHPYIALKGRVFCKIVGTVKKGDLLVTSFHPGYAAAWAEGDSPNAVIGKALSGQEKGYGVIEVLVV
ncbi:MAG: hypothetical protein ACOYNN_14505 [Terrimicrobiaceae bacterium]